MAHQTTTPLPADANGDIRYPSEAGMPIKARCIRCGGRQQIPAHHVGGPVVTPAALVECPHCNGRGYYFLPLGD